MPKEQGVALIGFAIYRFSRAQFIKKNTCAPWTIMLDLETYCLTGLQSSTGIKASLRKYHPVLIINMSFLNMSLLITNLSVPNSFMKTYVKQLCKNKKTKCHSVGFS